MAPQTSSQLRVSDPVLTQVVHGYKNSESIARFIAPVVPVTTRSGKIVKFTREDFAVSSTKRAPGDFIKRVRVGYTSDNYFLYQHSIGGEVPEEDYQEARNGEAKIDLRRKAAMRATTAIAQSWEQEIVEKITDPNIYEPGLVQSVIADDQFNNPLSDPEELIVGLKEDIRRQVGVYPNSCVIDPATFNALRLHPIYRDRIKYTSTGVVNLDLLASWWDLPRGIKVAGRVYLGPQNQLVDFMPSGTLVMFYAPDGPEDNLQQLVFSATNDADNAVPSAFYTYQLDGYPIVGEERFDEDRRVYVSDVIAEQHIVEVGLGNTGKVGAAALIDNLLAV